MEEDYVIDIISEYNKDPYSKNHSNNSTRSLQYSHTDKSEKAHFFKCVICIAIISYQIPYVVYVFFIRERNS